jgi:hypothetical protein
MEYQEGGRFSMALHISLLRAMLVRDDPPFEFEVRLLLNGGPEEHAQMVCEGMQLRAQLPAYLAQRRALLDAHCFLLPQLQALVRSYEEPTTEELWATGLGYLNWMI